MASGQDEDVGREANCKGGVVASEVGTTALGQSFKTISQLRRLWEKNFSGVLALQEVKRQGLGDRSRSSVGPLQEGCLIAVDKHGDVSGSEEVRRETIGTEVLPVPGQRVRTGYARNARCAVPGAILTLNSLI
jgi:hypothetical protein